jgi:cell division protein FtsL
VKEGRSYEFLPKIKLKKHMKKVTIFIIFTFFILFLINIFAFIKSIYLSNHLLKIEEEIKKLNVENEVLKNSIAQIDTLEYTASIAAQIDLNRPLSFWYFEPVKYARSY